MVNNRSSATLAILKTTTTDGSNSKQATVRPPSPTTSAEESNVLTATVTEERDECSLKGPKFEADNEVEVQSPDRGLLESFLADHLDFTADFMISSPRQDYMICSPRRDFMLISSPKRDYMISSPRRDFMMSSPKREYMVLSPRRTTGLEAVPPSLIHYNYSNNSKSQSPLQKVSNCSIYAPPYSSPVTDFLHGESLALPAVDAYLEDYGREGYDMHSVRCDADQFSSEATSYTGAALPPTPTAAALPSLLDCFVMESRYGGQMMAAGINFCAEEDAAYQHYGGGPAVAQTQYEEPQQKAEMGHGFVNSVGSTSIVSSDTNTSAALYHGIVGDTMSSIVSSEHGQEHDSGLQLVHLLLACAEAIAKDDLVSGRRYLHHLKRVVSPLGDSMQRVASCFTDALAARLSPTSSSLPSPSGYGGRCIKPPHPVEVLKIYQIIYQACPYIKFAHFTANQAIFEAFESEDCVHVIDLDILQGYQWPAFLQALAARPGGAPALRITGVGHPAEAVRETGRHLAELAHSLRVPFEFHAAAVEQLEDLRPSMLHRRVGEALAVNSVDRLHLVPGAHIGPLLAMIRDQAPKILTLVEQEASHNGPYFLGRFLEALHYYSAIFDSLDATFPAESAARAKVEQLLLAPEICNIVACEGSERVVRHERLERWRRMMEGRGFKGVALSGNAVNQSKILLGLYPCDGYRLTEDKGCLLLGWQDRPIIAASAWRC
ncbi:GRAS family protein RAM1-like [Zingiber officinale]|uniref:Uncharacterized protein n=1 Tax=Zingiber officinale TaxID=94328 RepID=A0A8J5HYD1_ZINOF|nr:GRAS family protein RAM1-like [Zingiber officinale]KAG6529347.1 hypothetical protein ZIOFF_011544 [Zingiber officinale]